MQNPALFALVHVKTKNDEKLELCVIGEQSKGGEAQNQECLVREICRDIASNPFPLSFNFNPISTTTRQRSEQSNIVKVEAYHKVGFYCYVKPFNLLNGSSSSRAMSTSKGRSMRSKVERRMQKESGKTLREIRRAKKLKKKLMTEEERLVYNLKRAKKKVALLLQKLKKLSYQICPPPRHDPELFTPEQLQAYKKNWIQNKNYVPVGVRGVFGGVVQNMHLHWKFHETVQVCCDNFPKEKIKEMASMLARLSGDNIFVPVGVYRLYSRPDLSKLLNLKVKHKENRTAAPRDGSKILRIQLPWPASKEFASTFFNAIDKKEGSPYVFREGNQSITEPIEADKNMKLKEAKEKEELGRIRYWNKEEFGGRFRRSDASRNDDYDGEVRGSRVWQTTRPKHRATDSEDEENAHSDDGDEWHSSNIADDSDIDSNSDGSNEARGRRNMAIKDSESEGMLSDVENAMWESDEEENDSGHLRQFSDKYKSSSSDEEDGNNGVRDHEGMWHSDAEEDSRVSRADRYSRREH
ncbi:YhbY-like superfamily [Sesbania bispinosa]|nr:YhbY-like superfamily [Sesbania bispinosa]